MMFLRISWRKIFKVRRGKHFVLLVEELVALFVLHLHVKVQLVVVQVADLGPWLLCFTYASVLALGEACLNVF